MTHKITHNDENYASAINYDDRNYYNYPSTIQLGKKLFILGAGTSDRITVRKRKDAVYIVSENSPLNYISLTVIDKFDNDYDVFLSGNDLDDKDNISYDLLDKTTFQQIKILSQYL